MKIIINTNKKEISADCSFNDNDDLSIEDVIVIEQTLWDVIHQFLASKRIIKKKKDIINSSTPVPWPK